MEGFICPVCKFLASDAQELTAHFAREHEGCKNQVAATKSVMHTSLSHQNMATAKLAPPPLRSNESCRVCSTTLGYSRTRRHCRNCGWAVCSFHSRNQTALPHIGFPHAMRVCDMCFTEITHDRLGVSSEQGLVMSGKLGMGSKHAQIMVLVKLSHLSMSLFRLSEDGSDDAGRLMHTLHLSDMISIRKPPAPACFFAVGDTAGRSLVLHAATGGDASRWVGTILQAKNDLLDAVRQLDPGLRAEGHGCGAGTLEVRFVTVYDPAAGLGPFPAVVASNLSDLSANSMFRFPVTLPHLSARPDAFVEVHLGGVGGTVRLDGRRLFAEAARTLSLEKEGEPGRRRVGSESRFGGAEDRQDGDDQTENDAKAAASWVRVKQPSGSTMISKELSLEMRVEFAPDDALDAAGSSCGGGGGRSSGSGSSARCGERMSRSRRSFSTIQARAFWDLLLGTQGLFDSSGGSEAAAREIGASAGGGDGDPATMGSKKAAPDVALRSLLLLHFIPAPLAQALIQASRSLDAYGWLVALASVGALLVALGAGRAAASGRSMAFVEGALLTGLGAVLLAPWILIGVVKGGRRGGGSGGGSDISSSESSGCGEISSGGELFVFAYRYQLLLTDFAWGAEATRAAATATAPVATAENPSGRSNSEEGGGGGAGGSGGGVAAAAAAAAVGGAIPERFVRMTRNDVEQAKFWWVKCVKWRAANPNVLDRPQPHYAQIKQEIGHYYHKRDRSGRLVYYEVLNQPRKAFKGLYKRGISVDDVVAHMTFINEYTHKVLNTNYGT